MRYAVCSLWHANAIVKVGDAFFLPPIYERMSKSLVISMVFGYALAPNLVLQINMWMTTINRILGIHILRKKHAYRNNYE